MIKLDDLFTLVDQLPAADKRRLIEHMQESMKRRKPSPIDDDDYQKFLTDTYGSLRDTPIERGDQGEYEQRELLE